MNFSDCLTTARTMTMAMATTTMAMIVGSLPEEVLVRRPSNNKDYYPVAVA